MRGLIAWEPLVDEASRRFGVPQDIIMSTLRAESGGRRGAVSPKGASGLMQVMPETYREQAQKYGLGPDRFDPRNNIMAGTSYLADNYSKYGNWEDTLAAYNAGPGRVDRVRAGTATMPAETRAYVPKVMQGANMAGRDLSFGGAIGQGGALVRGAPRPSLTGLLEVEQDKNWFDGLGGIWNAGATPSQPPRPEGPVEQLPTQTERLDVTGRMNELMQGLLKPQAGPPQMSPGQYMLAGAGDAVGKLAGVHDRKVGFGEILGALGGGLTRGAAAGEQAQQDQRAQQFQELTNIGKVQEYQREAATAASQAEAARRYAAQLRATNDPQKIALAEAVERDPKLVAKLVEAQAQSVWPKEGGGFTLGNTRFDAAGNKIVSVEPDRAQTLSPQEVQQLGLPPGTVAQRGADGKISVVNKPPDNPDQSFDKATKLRTEFTNQAKPMGDARQMYGRVQAAYDDSSGQADIALVYSYMKMLDPASVVREGEFATAEQAAGVPDRIVQLYNRAVSGERLPPQVRADMLRQAGKQYGAIEQQHTELENRYRDLAVKNGLDPSNVVIDFRGGVKVRQPDAPQPGGQTQPGGGNVAQPPLGERVVGQTYQTPRGPAVWRGNGWELAR